ncbi:MAG: hypothetical protein HC884_09050 [Chloroflexaceae bacterium]|nr:hypothetical protein [Chloroflexaceae bacterium]
MKKQVIFGPSYETNLPIERLPLRLLGERKELAIQRWQQDRLLVLCQSQAHQQIHRHIQEDRARAKVGLLAGHAFMDVDYHLPFVVVVGTHALCTYDDPTRRYIQIDPQDLGHTYVTMRQQYAGCSAVGWYHARTSRGKHLTTDSRTQIARLFQTSWHLYLRIEPLSNQETVFAEQGTVTVPLLPIDDDATPITDLLRLYNEAQELFEADQSSAAMQRLHLLQQQFADHAHSPDLQFWVEQGGYRDVQKTIVQWPTGSVDVLSTRCPPESMDLHRKMVVSEQHIQRLLQNQANILQQVQSIVPQRNTRSRRSFQMVDLIAPILVFCIILVLGADIYIQQSRTTAIVRQSQLLETTIAQNDVLATMLAFPLSPTVMPLVTEIPIPSDSDHGEASEIRPGTETAQPNVSMPVFRKFTPR